MFRQRFNLLSDERQETYLALIAKDAPSGFIRSTYSTESAACRALAFAQVNVREDAGKLLCIALNSVRQINEVHASVHTFVTVTAEACIDSGRKINYIRY